MHSSLWIHSPYFELFWNNSRYVSGLSVCSFVALCVCIYVAVSNKVGGTRTMSWCQEPMRFWHLNMTLLRVKQGHFESAILFFSIFRLLLRLKVFRSITSRYLYDLNIEYGDASFGMGAASIRYFWPNTAIAVNGTTHVYHNWWVLFLLFQGRV